MTLTTYGDRKYHSSARIGEAADWPSLRIEHRRLEAGSQTALPAECTEIVLQLGGRSGVVRTGNGETQEALGRPGMSWIVPAGTEESQVDLSGPMESLHIFLPATLIAQSALADYDIDPAKAKLAYAGGLSDPMLLQIGSAFRDLIERPPQPTDRLIADGMRAALAGHLLGQYGADQWRPILKTPTLDARRLKRVIDLVEARIATEISLDDLAAEACLSPFHFSRLFKDATGLSPHRYVTERRVQAARDKLALRQSSFVEIALDTGFGSQANFIRVFRKATGLTPGQYRELHAR